VFLVPAVVNYDKQTWVQRQPNSIPIDVIISPVKSKLHFLNFPSRFPSPTKIDRSTKLYWSPLRFAEMKVLHAILVGNFSLEEKIPRKIIEQEIVITTRQKDGLTPSNSQTQDINSYIISLLDSNSFLITKRPVTKIAHHLIECTKFNVECFCGFRGIVFPFYILGSSFLSQWRNFSIRVVFYEEVADLC
jgi:hypothetical protein